MAPTTPSLPPAAPLMPPAGTSLPPAGPVNREQEIVALQAQARAVADQLQAIQARIDQPGHEGQGTGLVAVVDPERCVGCGNCQQVCPAGAITVGQVAKVNGTLCTGCGRCVEECPRGALALHDA